MKKIIVADDEELILDLVSDYLTNDGYQPLKALDGQQALDLFDKNPDTALMILDVMMPNVDGWEVCRQIRKKSNVPVIMLTARNQEFDELMGFEAGADDYVVKPCKPSILMKRVEALLRRQSNDTDKNIVTIEELELNANGHEVFLNGEKVALTLKEYSLLYKLIMSNGRVFSREQLLDDIWGFDFDGDMRTVDSHMARLRTKLGSWGMRHIKTIYGAGYKIEM